MTSLFGSKNDVTDSHLARLFVSDNENGFKHSAHLGWLRWNGKHWESCDEDLVLDEVRQFHEALVGQHLTTPDIAQKLLQYLQASGIRRVMQVARAMDEFRVDDVTVFDADPDLLNVQNGVVDLRTGVLREHDPALMMTKIARAEYDPDARHPDIDAVLGAVPDPDVRACLQLLYGSGCSGRRPADDLNVILDGGGSNGKSTLNGAALGALGTYAGVIPDTLLSSDREHPTDKTTLLGLRLAVLNEMPDGRRLNTHALKKISSDEPIDARYMRQNYFTFVPTHTLVVATNFKPVVIESDRGTWRRLALVPFPLSYGNKPGDLPADPALRTRVTESPGKQAEAMLAWMIQGAIRWYASQRLLEPLPQVVQDATLAWRNEMDVINLFADEALVFDPTTTSEAKVLYAVYNWWATTNGMSSMSARSFNSTFATHEVTTSNRVTRARVRGQNIWRGVALKPGVVVPQDG